MTEMSIIEQLPTGTRPFLEQSLSLRDTEGPQAVISSADEQLQPVTAMVLAATSDPAIQSAVPAAVSVEYPKEGNEKKALSSFYRNLIDIVHNSNLEEPTDPKELVFCKLDCFCRTADCNLCKIAKWPFKSIIDLSPTLRRGRSKGWLLHRNMIFPLAGTAGRTVWVTAEFITVFITLCLSIARYSCGNNYTFNIIHLTLSIFASVLAFIDALPVTASIIEKFIQVINRKNMLEVDNSSTDNQIAKCCKKCEFDVSRMVLSELIFYPLLICAMFDMILFESYSFDNKSNQISFVLFIVSVILMLGFVYTPRIAVSIYAIYKKRYYFRRLIDTSTTKSSIHLQNYFILHSLGQIVCQIVMIAANGILIHAENPHFVTDESVNISGYLWYTLAAAYVLPFLGFLSFFLTTYWWLQEFPISISIDFLSVIRQQNITELLGLQTDELREKINVIIEHFDIPKLEKEFDKLHGKRLMCFKILLPFISPSTIVLSLLLLYLYAGYFTSAFLVLAYSALFDISLSWFVYLYTAVIVVYFMNLYAFCVASIWTIVIGVIAAGSIAAFYAVIIILAGLIFFGPTILPLIFLILCLGYINKKCS